MTYFKNMMEEYKIQHMKSHPDWSQELVYTVFFPETFKPKKKNRMLCFMRRFERDPVLPQQTTPPRENNEDKMTWSILKAGYYCTKIQFSVHH